MGKQKRSEPKSSSQISLDHFGKIILDTSIDGYCMLDLDGNILEVNNSWCRMLGYSRDELLSMNLVQIEASETPEQIFEHRDKIAKTGNDRFETRHRCKDGTIIDVEVSAQFCERPNLKIIFCFFRDITEKKRADDELLKFKIMTEQANYGAAIAELDGTLAYINEYFAAVHGYTVNELVGKNISVFHDHEQLPNVTEINWRLIQNGSYNALEVWHTHKDGTVFPMLMNAAIIKDENNKPLYLAATAIDMTEHKESEKALKDSELRYKTLFENAAEGIIVVETGIRKILYSNPCAYKLLGYTGDELKNLTVENLHAKKDWEYVLSEFIKQARGEKHISLDIPYLRKDGTVIYTDLKFAKVEIDARECWVAFIMDVTDRKMAELALRDSEHKHKTMFDNAVEGILVAELENQKITYANPAACRIFGYTEEEFKNMYVKQIHPPEHWEYVLSQFNAQARGEKSLSAYLPCLRKDDKIIYMDVNAATGIIDGKECMIGFFTDVTDRMVAEEALKESQQRYRTLFENATEGILVADIETKSFIYANPGLCKMLGYTEKELKGMHLKDIHSVEDWEFIEADFEDLAKGKKTLSANIPCLRKDGKTIIVDINTSRIEIDGRKCNVGFFTDITEYRRIKNELENYKEKVLQVQKHAYISSLGSIVAHQMSQPLTKISLLLDRAAEQIEKEACCPEAMQYARNAVHEVQNMASIIRNFRKHAKEFSFEGGGKVKIEGVADRIVSMLLEKAKKAQLRIYIGGFNELPYVEINESALEQIFLIIIQNAVEAADKINSHRLDITAKCLDGKVEIIFMDDCSGIPEENLDKIFEPFFTTKANTGGMGLGLDIVQQILIACGGTINVESELGKGTAFYITIPIADSVKS